MVHLKNLMLSRPYLSRIPAHDMLPATPRLPLEVDVNDRLNPARAAHPVATRDSEGRYALVYFPLAGQTVQVDLGALNAPARVTQIRAAWYDPRIGVGHPAGLYPADAGVVAFTSPLGGPDWVLTLDVA
jgi:hypothetical protein